MSVFRPAFRLTVYAPRSVDATETTALTPATGAPHSDPFVLTSIAGVTGARPYLDIPTARGATIDALNKKTSIGSLTVRILDARVTAGGGNAARWVTAFLGDGTGGNAFLGRRVKVEQSVDGGASWTGYFTGRIAGQSLDGKQWVQLSLRDIADDLNLDVFVGAPHPATVAYAALAQIAPLGLLRPVRVAATSTSPGTGYAGFPLTTPLRGKTTAPSGGAYGIDIDPKNGDPYRATFTQALVDATMRVLAPGATSGNTDAPGGSAQLPRVMVAAAGSSSYAEYDLNLVVATNSSINTGNSVAYTTSLTRLLVKQTNKNGVLGAAPPAAGTSVDLYIVDPLATPSERTPLLVDDVNPITYLTHLCAGYFGRLDSTGAVVRSVPINAASFAAIDTTSFVPWRTRITKASRLNAELEAVCLAYHLAYFIDASGALNLVDLRRSAVTAPAATLTDADLIVTEDLSWQQDRESAVTSFLGTYYPEHQIPATALPKPFSSVGSLSELPDVPTIGILELNGVSVLTASIGPRSADMKPSQLKVDAKGFRYRVDSQLGTNEFYPDGSAQTRAKAVRNWLVAYSDEIAGPFGLGPSYVDLTCRRASANVAAITQGKYAALSLSVLPDPATNQRGGVRLALCVSRTDDGPTVKLRLLDAGANSVALPPTLGSLTVSGHAVSLPVTINAAGEPVRVSYAVTDTSVSVAPADNDPAWMAGPLVTATGTATIDDLPSSQRVFLRARSTPGAGKGFKLPSAWVAPAPAYVDVTVITPPSGLAVTGATLDQQILTWTNGDASAGVDVFLTASAFLIARDGTRQAPTLAPGTTKFRLRPLVNGTTYKVAVRHHSANGGNSVLTVLTFTASGTTATLRAPTNPTGFSGSQDPIHGVPQADGSYGIAVAATVFPGFTEILEALETAPGSGVYGTAVSVGLVPNIQGDWTSWRNVAPDDGLRRQLTARHVSDGTNPSTETVGIPVQAWTAQPLGLFKTTSEIRPFSAFGELGTGDDTETIQRAIDWSAAGNGEVGQAGVFNIDGLLFRDGMRLICPGRTSTTFIPVAAPAAAAAILLDIGPVQKLAAEGFTVDMSAWPTQDAIHLKAVPIFVSGATQGGLWYGRFKDVWVIGCEGESFWLHGGDDSMQGPHQFLKFQGVVVECAATSSSATAGHALRMSGQVGQVDFDGDCRFDGISASTLGTNILIERAVDDLGANIGDVSPYSIALPVSCQSRDRLVTVERGLNISFDGAHFEESPEGVHVDVSSGLVTVQRAFFSNVGNRGDTTGFCVRCDSGQAVAGGNFFGGTVETHYVRRFGGSLTLRGGDADSSGIRTSGITPVILAAATIDTGFAESALISGGPSTAITTITSQLAVGKTLTLRANGADIALDTGGNIAIGSALDYRLPVRVKQDQAITLRRHDVSTDWVITGIGGARGAYRHEPTFVNAAASPYAIAPGSGTIRVDTSGGNVTLTLPSITAAPPGFRISIKKVSTTNTVFINGALTAQNPDGLATNACALTGLNQSIELERNGVSGVGGWDIVSGGALAGSVVVDAVAAGNPTNTNGVVSVRESSSHGYSLILQNRNVTRTWGVAIDAISVDDGIFALFDLSAGVSRLTIDLAGLVAIPGALTVSGNLIAGSISTSTLAVGAVTVTTSGGITGLSISDTSGHSALAITPASSSFTAFHDNRRVGSQTDFRSSSSSTTDKTWLTVTAAGNASFGFSLTIATGQLNITGGGIVTQAPAGGTAAAWKFGTITTGTYSLDTSHALQVEVGGVFHRVAIVV